MHRLMWVCDGRTGNFVGLCQASAQINLQANNKKYKIPSSSDAGLPTSKNTSNNLSGFSLKRKFIGYYIHVWMSRAHWTNSWVCNLKAMIRNRYNWILYPAPETISAGFINSLRTHERKTGAFNYHNGSEWIYFNTRTDLKITEIAAFIC